MNAKPAVNVADLTVAYRDRPVLWDIDLQVPAGALMAVVGPNGAGKSTLLKAILGLVKPVAGMVELFGQPYRAVAKKIAYVPQRTSVDWDFPATVRDVVLMGTYGQLGWFRRPGQPQRKLADEALARMGMQDYANRQISQLSGGQQQRVFLARSLVQGAELFFMDEPFQGVDATTEEVILKLLHELRNAGKTVVVVHHDLGTVRDYFDWVTLINVKKIASGQLSEVFTPENISQTYGHRALIANPSA
ncbi:metal ABC transporter ATP-binding protein [Zavarzinella formosa]|uniref:metal ABC transporter ATP-binding protein n=1 Tax=Zavarzinella formosa TaxID=360055 RepID=UPI00037347B9